MPPASGAYGVAVGNTVGWGETSRRSPGCGYDALGGWGVGLPVSMWVSPQVHPPFGHDVALPLADVVLLNQT